MAAATPPPLAPAELAALLQEFAEAPGNFLVRMGEPKALFAQLDALAGWAVGRMPPELSSQAEALRDAAVLFVLRACFAANNTHYQVLGISPKALTPEGLRTRYRALIRLTHPDMGVQGLPANAAGIVNRANEVLSDPDLRSRYDDLLASRKAMAPVEEGAAGAPQIELRASVRERWQSLVARFPTAVWAVPTALGAGTLGLGLLVWASSSSTDSRMLIVARADPQDREAPVSGKGGKGGKDGKPGEVPKPRNTSGNPWPSPAAERTARPSPGSTAAFPALPAPNAPNDQARPGTRPAAAGPVDAAPPPANVLQAALQNDAALSRASAQGSAQAVPPAPTPASSPPAMAARGDKDQAAAAPGRLEASVQAPQSAPVAAASPPPARPPAAAPPTPVRSPATVLTAAASPTPAPPPATPVATAGGATQAAAAPPPPPPPSPANPAWSVDTGQAKSYLAELIMSLERPSRARQNNSYLSEMNVQGSLLQPALQLMRRFPDVAVEHMNWNDSQRPGAMKLQGTVVVRVKNPDTGEAKRVNFRLNAEFWGTREGTVMASLNLREDD